MAIAAPPDLDSAEHPIQPLARTYPRGLAIEPHMHDWGQLLYAESGVMWVDTPSAALLVPPNRAVWIPPHIHHGVRVVSDLEMRNIYLREELAVRIGNELTVVEVSPLLRELIRRRVSVGATPDETYRVALDSLLVIELRQARTASLQVPMPANGDRRLRSLCENILKAPSLDISYEEHAQAIGASTRTLTRLFNLELGLGFSEWRRQVQLAYASARLLEGAAVSVIADELGFNLGSFSEMFRRSAGVAPSVYASHHLLR
ncbi:MULTISPECIES: helix-turn-helix transcriptional regulator [unclassified Pseudomonas]|uniref:AraC family transcriptional regulator n=1 Tax=unclassified Pseudomonas TaxID=196821 RepID=UPI00224A651E|nr:MULTISPECIES: helix-turn-helix transcriptional regulator [unclassified Pseudomonas]MCX2812480.1 helix-turn-helix transcriptional regulator [Pseudomonas sp. DCB_E]MCX9140527.1 helix-turn-helix transcriptional regulator [Pseudomonas sp. DCB_Q]